MSYVFLQPPAGDPGDAPPPLPSRPAHGNKPSMKLPPPPVQNGQVSFSG